MIGEFGCLNPDGRKSEVARQCLNRLMHTLNCRGTGSGGCKNMSRERSVVKCTWVCKSLGQSTIAPRVKSSTRGPGLFSSKQRLCKIASSSTAACQSLLIGPDLAAPRQRMSPQLNVLLAVSIFNAKICNAFGPPPCRRHSCAATAPPTCRRASHLPTHPGHSRCRQ